MQGIPGQLTMSVAAYLNLWIFRFWLCYLNHFWCIWKFCILLVLLFCWSLVIWKSDKHVEVTLCLNLWESVMIGITLETTAHDDSLKIFLPVLAGGGCSCWIWPKPTLGLCLWYQLPKMYIVKQAETAGRPTDVKQRTCSATQRTKRVPNMIEPNASVRFVTCWLLVTRRMPNVVTGGVAWALLPHMHSLELTAMAPFGRGPVDKEALGAG